MKSNYIGIDSLFQGSFESVIGTFVVPTPKSPGGSNTHAASAWVGIDGDTCGGAILQTGIDFVITNGKVSYEGMSLAILNTGND